MGEDFLAPAALEWRGDHPRSPQHDDGYYAGPDGLAESRYVFLAANQISARPAPLTVGEIGFGTGLNFLATWLARPTGYLHFISVEKQPLSPADLARALVAWPELTTLAAVLAGDYPPLRPGWHERAWEQGRVRLSLWFGEALEGLRDWPVASVDAWYLDGFAPARNRDAWSLELFQQLAARSHPEHTTFATFTAAGQVRRDLAQAGFRVEKQPGFGRKREMIRGGFAPACV